MQEPSRTHVVVVGGGFAGVGCAKLLADEDREPVGGHPGAGQAAPVTPPDRHLSAAVLARPRLGPATGKTVPARLLRRATLKLETMPPEGRHHRAQDAAWNIAALILRPTGQGRWPA